jgi:hypothetical protein
MNWIPTVSQLVGFLLWILAGNVLVLIALIFIGVLDYLEEKRQRAYWLSQGGHQNLFSIEARRQQLTAGLGRRVS